MTINQDPGDHQSGCVMTILCIAVFHSSETRAKPSEPQRNPSDLPRNPSEPQRTPANPSEPKRNPSEPQRTPANPSFHILFILSSHSVASILRSAPACFCAIFFCFLIFGRQRNREVAWNWGLASVYTVRVQGLRGSSNTSDQYYLLSYRCSSTNTSNKHKLKAD